MASRRQREQRAKRAARNARERTDQTKPSGTSNYARKKEYLVKAGKLAGGPVFGFQYEGNKPWK